MPLPELSPHTYSLLGFQPVRWILERQTTVVRPITDQRLRWPEMTDLPWVVSKFRRVREVRILRELGGVGLLNSLTTRKL